MDKMRKNPKSFMGQIVLLQGGSIGTVKYVGPLQGKENDWLGIKLSDGKGECNGTFRNVKYFSAPDNKGIFINPASVTKVVSAESLLEKVVMLNKKVKNMQAENSKLRDQLTLKDKQIADFSMTPGKKTGGGADDTSDAGIVSYVKGEIQKKWFLTCRDLTTRYNTRSVPEVESLFAKYKQEFEKLTPFPAHTRIVYTVCSSKRDNLIGSGSDDKTIRLWRRTGDGKSSQARCITSLALRSCINSLAFSPNGGLLAAALDSGWIELYDLETGKMVGALEGQTTSEVWTICFSPDGRNIISGALDRAVRIWDVQRRECRWALRGHDEWVNGVAVSDDGGIIVSGSGDKTVRIWETKSMKCVHTLRGHTDFVRSVCVSGQRVISASDDCALRVWDSKKGVCEKELKGHSKGIYSVAAGRGNSANYVASASRDATVKVWNLENASVVNTFKGHKGDVNSCCFLGAKGEFIASGSDDKTVQIFQATP